ncbi:MAG: hypothetical protein U0Y10_17650 [Spirosomataceae bacterium]
MLKWIAGALAVGSGYLLLKSSQLKQLSKEFIIRTNVRVHQFTGLTITFAVDVVIINPTDASVLIEHPFVTIFNSPTALKNNEPFVTSELRKETYRIKPNVETAFSPIFLKIDFFNATIGSALWKMLQALLAKDKITLYVRTTAKVAGIKTIEQVKDFTYGG